MVQLLPWILASLSRHACTVNEYYVLNIRGRVSIQGMQKKKRKMPRTGSTRPMSGPEFASEQPHAMLQAGGKVAGKLLSGKGPGHAGQYLLNMIQRLPIWPRRPMASWPVSEILWLAGSGQ